MTPSPATLSATDYLDAGHPAVQRFAREAAAGAGAPREQAARLFLAVRDGIRYNPYGAAFNPETYRASNIAGAKESFCVPKAILLAAAARALGIPAQLGFADVKNHLSSPRLLEVMRTDAFVFHGYTVLFLDGRWLKATPAFDRRLCERFGVQPLEFDGTADAMFQEFDIRGRRHMQYLRDHGWFEDFPFDRMLAAWRAAYPHFFESGGELSGDLVKEIERGSSPD